MQMQLEMWFGNIGPYYVPCKLILIAKLLEPNAGHVSAQTSHVNA